MAPPDEELNQSSQIDIKISKKFLVVLVIALLAIVIISLVVTLVVVLVGRGSGKCKLLSEQPHNGLITLVSSNNLARLKINAYIHIESSGESLGYLSMNDAKLYYESDDIAPKLTISFGCGQIIMLQSLISGEYLVVDQFAGYLTYYNEMKSEHNRLFVWNTGLIFFQSKESGHYFCDKSRTYYSNSPGDEAVIVMNEFELETTRQSDASRSEFQSPRDKTPCHTMTNNTPNTRTD